MNYNNYKSTTAATITTSTNPESEAEDHEKFLNLQQQLSVCTQSLGKEQIKRNSAQKLHLK